MTAGEIVGVHPYAEKFPMLSDAELDELAESIATVGLLHPIVINSDGLVLDGRNRLEACNRAQVEARTELYEGSDVAEFVIASNVTRRNMSTGARAMSTALVLEADGRRSEGKWDGARSRSIIRGSSSTNSESAWVKALTQCGVVIDYKSDLALQVISGEVSLNDAFKQAESIRTSAEREKILAREIAKREKAEAAEEAERNAKIVADLTESGAEVYLDMIEAETVTPQAAWAAYREDTRKERERAQRERQRLSERYTSMAQAILSASSWGEYENFQDLMSDFEPSLLNPPQIEKYFDISNLEAAARFVSELIAWRKS